MKQDFDIRAREHQFKLGEAVYWHQNAGKKVESMWIGPGVIVEAKSNTVFAVKSCREVKIMHHEKLKVARGFTACEKTYPENLST